MESLEIDQAQQRPSTMTTTTTGGSTSGNGTAGNYKPISDPSLLPKKTSNISGACSNLVNSIVGAGIIGIPYALKESGLVSGILLLIVVGYFTTKSLQMIVDLATSSSQLKGKGVWTYNDLLELPYGLAGKNFVLISMFITAYGAMVAYLLIIKDTLPVILGLVNDADESVGGFMERELVMIITSLVVCVPLSMQRDFSSLAYTSSVSVFADILLVVFVAIFAPIGDSVSNAGGLGTVLSSSILNPGGFFIGFGVLTVAMCCQHSAFIVASSLDNPNPKRWSIVTSISLTISVICCLVLGVSGYLGFLDETSGDVLNNFGVASRQANIARGLLALTMFFTYPMEAFVARHVLVELIWGGDMNGYTIQSVIDDDTGEEIITQKRSKCFCGILNRRHQVTVLIYILTLMPALIVDDLGPVLSITGAIGGCSLAYIGPGLAYLGIYGDDFLQRCANIILSMNTKKTKTTQTIGEAELPIDGDATAQMEDNVNTSLTVDPRLVFSKDYMKGYTKPYWWYIIGMPIWISIALKGSNGLNERLTALESDQYRSSSPVNNISDGLSSSSPNINSINENGGNGSTAATTTTTTNYVVTSSSSTTTNVNATAITITTSDEDETSTVVPCIIDYGFAIFFIVFGAIALVAGVASNVYVQMRGMYIAQ
jgi:sodium-coupled neutral amino acid transporter 11